MNKPLLPILWFCLLLAVPAPAQVDVQDFNRMGVLVASEMFWDSCLLAPVDHVYLVGIYLWNPMNDTFGGTEFRPVQNVGGFECKLTASGTATILARHYPVPAIDVGTYGSLIVGYGEPVPVDPEGPTLLAQVDVLFLALEAEPAGAGEPPSPIGCDGGTGFLWMAPAVPTSLAGQLAYLDADDLDGDPLVAAQPLTWLTGNPILTIAPLPTPVAQASWDQVKAHYR